MSTFIQKGGFTDLVATTRVRLARNVRGYTYRGLGLGEYREIADKVWSALQTAPAIASDFAMTEVRAGSQEAAALVEKHLISPDLARKGGFLIASSDGGAAIMIGEEDHIRLQVLGSGLCIFATSAPCGPRATAAGQMAPECHLRAGSSSEADLR